MGVTVPVSERLLSDGGAPSPEDHPPLPSPSSHPPGPASFVEPGGAVGNGGAVLLRGGAHMTSQLSKPRTSVGSRRIALGLN